jgi:serine/threonine protein kinase/formylglycine-generating enzyme required for sulfatase activity
MNDPATPTPRTTGGNVRWEPPSPAELQEQMPGYTIDKLLGRGGMGAVYKGVQSNLDRPVAIKILPPGVDQEDPSFAERFKNEARLMARLNNPAVVSVHDFGLTTGGLLYFAMEYVDGTDVSQMIRSQGRLPPDHALAITAHVCDALSAAHELGIVHRDIKPANVLINMKGQVKVADFGLAKIEEPGTHGLTKTGYAMGTPDFVAPEVLMLGSHIDGRADLYAVGVMLYQMLTGEVPRGAFKPATVRLPGLDPRFDPIILKAMQSDREERYQSSTELRRDLDVILTVPLVRQDEPPTSAIPTAQVAQTPAQRSAAQKPRSAGAPTRQPPAHAGEGTRAPVPPKSSSAPLLLGLGAVVALGIGAFVMMGGGEKAQQSGPLSPLSGTSVAPTPKAAQGTGQPPPPPPFTVSQPPKPEPKPAIIANAPEPPKPVVQVPPWLQEARKRGGRLRFYAGGKESQIEKGETEKFDDFVEVSVTSNGWFALRANGETHAISWQNATLPAGKAFQPFTSSAMMRGPGPKLKDVRDATFRTLQQGQLVVRTENVRDIHCGLSLEGHLVSLGRNGSILQQASTQKEVRPPPADFFKNYSFVSNTKDHYVVARADLPPQSWNVRLGTLAQYPAEISGVVNLDSSRDHVILLTADGKVHVTSGDGAALPSDSHELNPPSNLPPAIAVRAGSFMSAAQKTDGTWAAWGRSRELTEKVKKLGPVIDLDLHFATIGFMLWIEAPSATIAGANKDGKSATPTSAPAPSASPSPSPPIAASAPSALDQRLAALDSSFHAAVERDANTAFKASMDALDKLYLGALDRALATASKDGKLEEALTLREEKQRIEKGQGVPSEVDESTQAPGKVPETLKTLRQTYRGTNAQHEATKAKAMQPLYDKYDQALAAVQTELSQAQKLDDAMRVKTVRERIAATRSGGLQPHSFPQPQGTPANPGSVSPAASATAVGNTHLLAATKDKPFTNSLGMKFVPVPDTDILMCIHETRYKDYAAYAGSAQGVGISWKDQTADGFTPTERSEDHPVMNVTWDEAKKFCDWLSEKEGMVVRLPTDREWSYAVGIGRDENWKDGVTPEMRSQESNSDYPWGTKWPPPKNAGNYSDTSRFKQTQRGNALFIADYDDGFPTTAPVMSFKANKLGIYDLGGNLWEWCEDWKSKAEGARVTRGGSWFYADRGVLRSAQRDSRPPNTRYNFVGFRVVLETRAPASPSGAATKPMPSAPPPAPATAAKSDFTNSLGMKFVKVPGTKVLFCIHETRTQDFKAFTAENADFSAVWISLRGSAETPVSAVSWEDANAFCVWLSKIFNQFPGTQLTSLDFWANSAS